MNNIRHAILAALVIITVALVILLTFLAPFNRYYPLSGYVIDISGDLVTVQDGARHLWKFWGAEDWMVGDMVSLLMHDNGTRMIYDDRIIRARYAGFTAPAFTH